jgi:uncharacterized protein (DUF1330 family)
VLLQFPDADAAVRLFRSPEYLEIAKDRDIGAEVELQVVNSLE